MLIENKTYPESKQVLKFVSGIGVEVEHKKIFRLRIPVNSQRILKARFVSIQPKAVASSKICCKMY